MFRNFCANSSKVIPLNGRELLPELGTPDSRCPHWGTSVLGACRFLGYKMEKSHRMWLASAWLSTWCPVQIDDFDFVSSIQQDVARIQVSEHDTLLVAVAYGTHWCGVESLNGT